MIRIQAITGFIMFLRVNYITNSEKITSDDYSNAIKNGKVFIDGWTASLNGTLQNYKEDVKIVF